MIEKKALSERLRALEKAESLSGRQVALRIGADISYYNRARNGNGLSQDYMEKIVIEFGVSKSWLALGEGSMYPVKKRHGKHTIPLWDAGAVGSRITLANMDKITKPVAMIEAGEYQDATGAMYMYHDDSIAPKYKAKDTVVFKQVSDRELILYGADYIIQTKEFRILRNIQRGNSKTSILICCHNTSTWKAGVLKGRLLFEPFEIPIKKIIGLYLVLGKI
jgi:transcriptional regulator with XRE-family HTH domain